MPTTQAQNPQPSLRRPPPQLHTDNVVDLSRSTGKERDSESGNDYFDARYYSSTMGRFLSPDWSAQEEPVPYAHLDDPQSLNLYSYVLNNPLAKADLDGHGCPPDCGDPTSPTAAASPSGIQNLLMLPITGTIGMLKAAYNSLVAGDIEDPLHGDVILSVPAMQPANDGEQAGMTAAPLVVAAGAPEMGPEAEAVSAESSAARAGEVPTSIPAGPTPKPTKAQQAAIDEMFEEHGCYECGTRTPGTKSGHAVGDHVPSTSQNTSGGPQVYKPHCLRCSLRQGGRIRAAQAKAAAAAKKAVTPQ